MITRTLIFISLLSSLLAAPSRADFVGIKIENVTDQFVTTCPDPQGLTGYNTVVYELYANFTDPNDVLQLVFNVNVQAENDFYHALNAKGQEQATPLTKNAYDALGSKVDSFVTIGFEYAGKNGNPGDVANPVALDPAFNERLFLDGNMIGVNAGWFANPPTSPAGKAGTFNDLKVLIARFAFVATPEDPCLHGASLGGSLRLNIKDGSGPIVQTGVLEFFIRTSAVFCGCWGDFNHDEFVDGADLGLLLANWGEQTPGTNGDIDLNGVVDGADLGVLLSLWGPCCDEREPSS